MEYIMFRAITHVGLFNYYSYGGLGWHEKLTILYYCIAFITRSSSRVITRILPYAAVVIMNNGNVFIIFSCQVRCRIWCPYNICRACAHNLLQTKYPPWRCCNTDWKSITTSVFRCGTTRSLGVTNDAHFQRTVPADKCWEYSIIL